MPYIVGICGGSGSGKTFLLRKLLATFSDQQCALISQDNYYKPKNRQILDEDGLINFDHPDSLDLDKFVADIQRLMAGETIEIEEYTFNNEHRKPQIFTYKPTPIIIVEGILIYHKKELADLMDLKIFVDAEEHIRLSRRILRDEKERNYSYVETIRDYNKFVAPMYTEFVEPTKKYCDIIINNHHHHDMRVPSEVITHHLQMILNNA